MSSQIPDNNALSLYEQTICTDSGQYFCNARQFVLPVSGNAVEIVHCGATYFSKAAAAMRTATNFIWIADWQMAFDVELDQRGHDEHPGRVLKIIEDIIQRRPVQIKVLLYKSVTDGTVGTYERLVSSTLNAINKPHFPGRVEVVLQGPTSAQRDFYEYSHHQKFIVVDGRVAFIGGLDLTHGRYETPEFDVVINPKHYVLNEMRNPCVANRRPVSEKEDNYLIEGFAAPYAGALLEEGCQPRMPWQDVQ